MPYSLPTDSTCTEKKKREEEGGKGEREMEGENEGTCMWRLLISRVMVEQVVGEAMEEVRLTGGEESIMDLVDGLLQLGVFFVVLAGVVAEGQIEEGREVRYMYIGNLFKMGRYTMLHNTGWGTPVAYTCMYMYM